MLKLDDLCTTAESTGTVSTGHDHVRRPYRIYHLLRFVRPYWWYLATLLLATLLSSAITFTYPAILGGTIDGALLKKRVAVPPGGEVVLVCLLLGQGLIGFWHSYWSHVVGERVVLDLRYRLYRRLQALSLRSLQDLHTGELLSRITNDAHLVQMAITRTLIYLISTVFTVLLGLVVIIIGPQTLLHQLHLKLPGMRMAGIWNQASPWMLLYLVLVILPFLLSNPFLRRAMRRQLELLGDATRTAEETLSNQAVIKTCVREEDEVRNYEDLGRKQLRMARRGAFIASLAQSASRLFGIIGAAIFIWFAGSAVASGKLSIGTLVMSGGYLYLLARPFTRAGSLYSTLQKDLEAAERIGALLDHPVECHDAPNAPPLPPVHGNLRFEEVYFGYDEQQPILRAVSFEAEAGQMVALVGPSGAGKSTLVNLVPRFFDVQRGRITLDGYDIRHVQRKSLRAQIGIVLQEPVLFSTTIRDNIAYGRPKATLEEVQQVARAANAHDFIMQLPLGYDTPVGERGAKLSLGQRQRIVIARTLLRDPRILILDEATSALDSESEELVQEALERLRQGRTMLVITHRLATIERADKIIVLEQGRIVEQGTHDSLLLQGGTYARLAHHSRSLHVSLGR